jgi:hypothetical protein
LLFKVNPDDRTKNIVALHHSGTVENFCHEKQMKRMTITEQARRDNSLAGSHSDVSSIP